MLTIHDHRLFQFEFEGQACVLLPDNITGIGTKAFYGEDRLRDIVLPGSVVTIGDYAFGGCHALEHVELQAGLKRLGTGCFQGCTSLREIRLPEGTASLHACAFESCASLASVSLPQSLRRNIEGNTFAGCTSLSRITIPGSVQQIKSGAFFGCTALEDITFENPEIIIDRHAFTGCTALSIEARVFIEAHLYRDDTIDINSRAAGPAGRLSNYTERHFILDGVECRSIEGALQSLKCPDVNQQRDICRLVGGWATRAGKAFDWEKDQLLYWRGDVYPRRSVEYHQLISRIYDAAFEQDFSFREDLSALRDKEIGHRMGRTNPSQTILTRQEFISQLKRLMERSRHRTQGDVSLC